MNTGMRKTGALMATLLLASTLSGQERSAKAVFAADKWIPANEPFEIALQGERSGDVAVTINKLDVTSLFERPDAAKLRYHGRGPALPAGEHTINVYDVEATGKWTKIGQFPIKLLSPLGFIST